MIENHPLVQITSIHPPTNQTTTAHAIITREERVRQVLEELNLTSVKDSLIGDKIHRGVSGGERKRVSIGKELCYQVRRCFCVLGLGLGLGLRLVGPGVCGWVGFD